MSVVGAKGEHLVEAKRSGCDQEWQLYTYFELKFGLLRKGDLHQCR